MWRKTRGQSFEVGLGKCEERSFGWPKARLRMTTLVESSARRYTGNRKFKTEERSFPTHGIGTQRARRAKAAFPDTNLRDAKGAQDDGARSMAAAHFLGLALNSVAPTALAGFSAGFPGPSGPG
jgi:hypothetical protein